MKPTKIKAWPELVGFLPSLPKIRELQSEPTDGAAGIEVDFASVRAVNSTGLTVFLLRLLELLAGHKKPLIRRDCQTTILIQLERLGAFTHLADITGAIEHELPLSSSSTAPTFAEDNDSLALPVYRLRFGTEPNRRLAVHRFVSWLAENLGPLRNEYIIEPNGLIMLLNEIAKNTADHARADALFGLDVIPLSNGHSRLTFAFGDLGMGIKKHIERNLPAEEESRRQHMSLYEAYRLALKPGYTSSADTELNKGHGMSIIIDCAIDLDIHLSVFDALSRGLLSSVSRDEKLSHALVRRIFHSVGHHLGFFYFGELMIRKRHI
jgi:hypothetical protein